MFADITNNEMIIKFERGIYEQNPFGVLGFFEPYVNHYNRGNIYFALGDYERASEEYLQAMKSDIDDPNECRLRTNYALSLVKPLDIEHVNEENLDEILAVLDEARDVLCEDGCAHRDDNNGHWPDAQTLKNEIDELYDRLTNPPDPDDPNSQDPDASPTPTPTPTPSPTPEGGEETPTPSDDPGGPTPTPEDDPGGPTPTPDDGSGQDPEATPTPEGGQATPTPEDGGQGQATPTPTQTPEEMIMDIQGQSQQERYAGANGMPSDDYVWNMGEWASW